MKLNRLAVIATCMTLTACMCSAFKESDENEPKDKPGFLPILHQNHPRFISIFSKPPDKDAPKQTGPGIIGHLGNVLQGGSIGIELSAKPLGAFQGILDHAKKIIPGGHDTVGQPHYEKPHDKPKPDEDEWEMQEPAKIQTEKPDKSGYNWDDIGEDQDDYSTEIPIEDIIMPRRRPKRFIESKIYHVPLTFRSNGKPYRVVEKTENSVGRKEKL